MDWTYKKEATRYREEHGLPNDTELKMQLFPDFPLERARLKHVWWLNGLFSVTTAIYGFSVEWNIAVPLFLQFISKLLRKCRSESKQTNMFSCFHSHGNLQYYINSYDRPVPLPTSFSNSDCESAYRTEVRDC